MATAIPQPKPGILDIDPYVPGESSLPAGVKPIKLSSNETPLGPSPKALAAFRETAGTLERYPDGNATALRDAIAARYGLNPTRIVCGAGSDELLTMLAHAYLGEGDEAIFTEHGFLLYKIIVLSNGATPVVAPETNLRTDIGEILARVTNRTKVVFLANPNNPTGTYISIDEVRSLRALPAMQAHPAPRDLPAVRAVGYRQAWEFLDAQVDAATFRERAIAATRQLAKRQWTWLRSEFDMFWCDPQREQRRMDRLVEGFLG